MVNAGKIIKTAKTLGTVLASSAVLYASYVFCNAVGTYTYGQRFLDNKTAKYKFTNPGVSQEPAATISDEALFHYAVQHRYLNDPTTERLEDVSKAIVLTPEQSRKKIQFDKYSHVYLDHDESISVLAILEQAKRQKKDSVLFETVTEKKNQNRYRVVPVSKLTNVYHHNQESQQKLALKNVGLVIKNKGAESGFFSCTPFVEYQIELDETCLRYSADVLNFTADHEAGHAVQAARDFGWIIEKERNWIGEQLGSQGITQIEDEADKIAATINPKAAKAVFEMLFPVAPFESITLEKYHRTIADISGNKGQHSPNMTRIKNVIYFSDKVTQPK